MKINVDRKQTDRASIAVSFDDEDLALAFPPDSHDAELYFQLFNACGKTVSQELITFAQVAKLIEDAEAAAGAAALNPTAGTPEPK